MDYLDGQIDDFIKAKQFEKQSRFDLAVQEYEKAIQLADQYERPGLKDYFQLNYANVLFQLEDFLPELDITYFRIPGLVW